MSYTVILPPPSPVRAPIFPPRVPPTGSDVAELLDPRIDVAAPDWLAELAPRKAFRVRGLSWFRLNIVLEVAALSPYLPRVPLEIAARPGWNGVPLPWSQQLSIRQVYDAVDKQPLLFHKAAEICLLCELAAAAPPNGRPPVPAETLYEHLRIEPALWRISDFDQTMVDRVERERPDAAQVVRRRCSQTSVAPMHDVAAGKTVSHRLAVRMVRVLRELVPHLPIGDVVLNSQMKRNGICLTETIDGPSEGDWNEPLPA